MTSHQWLSVGSALAGLAVALGAFGAHALKKTLSQDMLAIFETGVRYQMYHALAILAVGLIAARVSSISIQIAGWSFLFGTLLFSGSLYVLAYSGVTKLGMITPFGGALFLIGWAALAFATIRSA